ncbi:MAG: autotransporter-associated beta strand repeat-containing protein [Kiritimatiellae bacterium]|nr:autotransporter-associated beta strand repeat-containing protein [Kiritimatiellia bacterium]
MIADWAMSSDQLKTMRDNSAEPEKETADALLPDEMAFEVGFNGLLQLHGDQTLATLGGDGAAGGIELNNALVCTAQGIDSPTSTVFYSAIKGDGRFVKSGSDYTLTLAGANSYTGATEVAAGTLALFKDELAYNPQAWYRFDDPSELGKDSSGNAYDLDVVNTPYYDASGRRGGAAGFNTADLDMLRYSSGVPATFPTGNSSYTFAVWCNPNVANTLGMPLYWGSISTSDGYASLFRFDGESQVLFSNFGNNKTVSSSFNLFENSLNNGWHHIASTYNGVTHERKIYIDGELKSSDTRSNDLNIQNELFQLGGAPYSTANYYDGLLDDVMIFNNVLESDDIAVVMGLTSTAPVPVACYRFEDGDNPGLDSSDNGYDLVSFGEVAVTDSGREGKALELTSLSQCYLAWTNSVFPALLPTGNEAASFSMWINPDYGADREGAVLYFGKLAADSCHVIRLTKIDDNSPLGIRYTNAAYPLESYAVNGIDLGDGIEGWHHVAVVYDPVASKGSRNLYIDGVLVAQDNENGLSVGTNQFYIGRMFNPSDKWFKGMIDEVQIFDQTLTHQEILGMIRNGADILPVSTTLNVASDAVMNINGVSQQVASLTGAGDVNLGDSLSSGTLTIAGGSGVFEGAVSGSGNLLVCDGAEQTLAGASTFSGSLTVSNATLLIENTVGSATGSGNNVRILSGGLLGGSGSISGDVTIAADGGLVTDFSSIGITVDGTVNLPASGIVNVTVPQDFTGGRMTLISATTLSAPSDFDGWSVEGVASPLSSRITTSGNTLSFSVFYAGTMIMVK